jgi:hypothetical protein
MYEITVKCATPEEFSQVAAKLAGGTVAAAGNPKLQESLAKAEAVVAETSKPAKAGKAKAAPAATAAADAAPANDAPAADFDQKSFLEQLKAFVQKSPENAQKTVAELKKNKWANGMAVPEGSRRKLLTDLGALVDEAAGEPDMDALFGDTAAA